MARPELDDIDGAFGDMPSVVDLLKIGPRAKRTHIDIHPTAVANRGFISITGDDCVLEIGEGVVFGRVELSLKGDHSVVRIGSRSRINNSLWANLAEPGTRLEFGEDCLLANVMARTSDSHNILDAATGERLNPPGDIIVGRHVWLAQDVLLLKGTRIGENCVIGARSMVNCELPEGSLCAGTPARVIRQGVTWSP